HKSGRTLGASGDVEQEASRSIVGVAGVGHLLKEFTFLIEPLSSKLVGIIEDDRSMHAASNRQRLSCINIHEKVWRRLWSYGIGGASDPPVFIASIRCGRLPICHRGEMGKRRVGITATVND